jgi:xanthine dehydrogenase molybdopterin-binding subunit B
MSTQEQYHDSAEKHVSGESVYINDLDGGSNMLHGHVLYSSYAHAKIIAIDISKAEDLQGVHTVLTAKDIPGHNQMGPVVHDEICLAEDEVTFVGQAIALIAAESSDIARAAANLIKVDFKELPAILTLDEAIAKGELLGTPSIIKRGDK